MLCSMTVECIYRHRLEYKTDSAAFTDRRIDLQALNSGGKHDVLLSLTIGFISLHRLEYKMDFAAFTDRRI